jgi:geranylgeranyl diphosphate synthase type I
MVLHTSSIDAPALGARVDEVLRAFLAERREDMAALDPSAAGAIDEVLRLIDAGGKRLRPILCYWGYRAGGGSDGIEIVRAASALELLHTMALIHDDLIDAAAERRGVETVHVRLTRLGGAGRGGRAGAPRGGGGRAGALLVGDLAAVLADLLLLESGFPPEALARALDPYHRMRMTMAAGQWLELLGAPPADTASIMRRATLRGGAYTTEGPLAIGAALAGTSREVAETLARFGEPLGRAFQLRDDLEDGESTSVTATDVDALVELALAAVAPLPREARDALTTIGRGVAFP